MSVTFIILNYYQSFYIRYIIQSIRYSRIFINYNIVIVDNNSDIQDLAKIHNVYITSNQCPNNKSKSRNLGIKYSLNTHMIFIDGDDYLIPLHLSKVLEVCLKKYDSLFCQRLQFNDKNRLVNSRNKFATHSIIISRSISIKHNIFFEENIFNFIYEDLFFLTLYRDKIATNGYNIINANYVIYNQVLVLNKYNIQPKYILYIFNVLYKYLHSDEIRRCMINRFCQKYTDVLLNED